METTTIREMKAWKAEYSVWSFYWNDYISFRWVVVAATEADACGLVKAHNSLAEKIHVTQSDLNEAMRWKNGK